MFTRYFLQFFIVNLQLHSVLKYLYHIATLKPLEILKKYWNFDQFRPMQMEIIQSVLDGKDTLALLPTGGGKSICFQVPALAKEGICIVVSPLIALMQDQVQNLNKRGIQAAAIYSGMHYREIDRTLDNCIYGKTKFLYLSPERLASELAIERIKKMNVNLLAIDEAHCISQWGYDFRPPYLEIAKIREWLPKVPVLALTATATKDVVVDIQEKLEFKKNNVFQQSFARDNLAYVVLNEENKLGKMLDMLRKVGGSGIVYVRNRRKTKEIAKLLLQNNISADFYHGGLPTKTRSLKQANWVNNKTRIMVSTNAFGMGIDKPDVRMVIHLDLPDSLEAYFQEAGRGGRDGRKAYATLLYNEKDRIDLEKNFEKSFPDIKYIKQVYQALGSYFQLAVGSGIGESFDFDIINFCERYRFEIVKSFNALKVLEKAGWLLLTESVYIPSTLHIKISKEKLYDYQIRNSRLDKLLKVILRTYHGAFNHTVNINENKLSRFINQTEVQLKNALLLMKKDGIIDYTPQKEKPQIIFIQERVAANNLMIDKEQYQLLKERQENSIKSSIAYATTEKCRSQQLLAYFGEEDADICGKCDVDLGVNKENPTKEEYYEYKEKIFHILTKRPLALKQLVDDFSSNKRKRVVKAIEFMLDREIIFRKGNLIHWKR